MSMRHGWLLGSALLLCAHVAAAEQVIKTIQVGNEPTFSISNSDGTRIYVGNAATADLTVIDTVSDSIIATIPLPHNSGTVDSIHLTITPDGTLVYAVDENVTSTGTVNVISTATNAIVATIPASERPTDIAIRPDGAEVYVVNHYGTSVSVITTANYQVAALPIDGYYPFHVAFSPDSRRAYVTRYGAGYPGGVTVLDTTSRTVVGAIDDAGGETVPFVSRDGSKLYVTYYDSSADGNVVLRVISTDTVNDVYRVTAELRGPAASAWMAMSSDDGKGYLVSSLASIGQVFDGSGAFSGVVNLPGPAMSPAWEASTRRIFVPHFQSNIVSVIDAASDTIVASYRTGNQPWSIAIARSKKYVTNRADGTVSVIGELPPPVASVTTVSSNLNPSTFGQWVTLNATVTGSHAMPTGDVQFFDGTTLLGGASLSGGTAALRTSAVSAGLRSITAVYVPSGNFVSSTSPVLAQTVNKATGTTSLTISVLTPTYSDLETFRASFTPGVAGGPAPQKVAFRVGSQVIGAATPSLVNGAYQYTWTGQMLDPAGSTTHQMKPDFRSVTAIFADPNFSVANPPPKAIIINAEDARVRYTGPTSVSLGGTTGCVVLTVVVKDISAVSSDPARDPYPGDISNAQVYLIDRSTNTILSIVKPTLTGTDSTVGTATFNWSVNLGTAKSKTYTLGFMVGYYYRRNSMTDNAIVVVSK